MRLVRPFLLVLVLLLGVQGLAEAQFSGIGPLRLLPRNEIERLNSKLAGQVLDYTYNHRVDRRLYSSALCEKRDLYVYLPPCYDKTKHYPLMIWLHGLGQDEKNFLSLVKSFDDSIRSGELPHMIIASPDGRVENHPTLRNKGSFYINSNAGRFDDYIMIDIWDFLHQGFSVLPDRNAHVLAGASMGGYGAINLGIKHRDKVGNAIGIMPPLNIRYSDCHGDYFGKFDPNCFQFDEELKRHAPIAKFYGGLLIVRKRQLSDHLFGKGPDTVAKIAADNPTEMLESYQVKPGELNMFVAYGKKDEFNIDSQVESFLYFARSRGIEVTAYVNPTGRHNTQTGLSFSHEMAQWLTQRVPPVK
ncbi:hypothetical protein KIH39_21560 [Telmatocola sphagniphila]|uniref:Esterase n=1 Tax=Telmatocola sphagniphila TaxID=1123043 RepID=A0A8E6B3S0_9BACT|nr:alpha/beta hydrolase-fold protein [Telmatocola sphagniphila]QVL31408.1 hypothetical protein KIH39_21560 [Telmatocola sphagniphila]